MATAYKVQLWDRALGPIPNEDIGLYPSLDSAVRVAQEVAEQYLFNGERLRLYFQDSGDVVFRGDGDTGTIVVKVF